MAHGASRPGAADEREGAAGEREGTKQQHPAEASEESSSEHLLELQLHMEAEEEEEEEEGEVADLPVPMSVQHKHWDPNLPLDVRSHQSCSRPTAAVQFGCSSVAAATPASSRSGTAFQMGVGPRLMTAEWRPAPPNVAMPSSLPEDADAAAEAVEAGAEASGAAAEAVEAWAEASGVAAESDLADCDPLVVGAAPALAALGGGSATPCEADIPCVAALPSFGFAAAGSEAVKRPHEAVKRPHEAVRSGEDGNRDGARSREQGAGGAGDGVGDLDDEPADNPFSTRSKRPRLTGGLRGDLS